MGMGLIGRQGAVDNQESDRPISLPRTSTIENTDGDTGFVSQGSCASDISIFVSEFLRQLVCPSFHVPSFTRGNDAD